MVDKFRGSVFFSATLSPLSYYKKILFGRDNFKDLIIPSPFPKNNFKLLVNNSISLLYKDRTKSIGEIIKEIKTFVDGKTGNYIVFCPSFEYLDMLEKSTLKSSFKCIFQKRYMNFIEKDEFLNSFEENPNESFVGFCVLGGIFSEGIDLVGSRLIGTVVIGVGLPMLSFENNLLKNYYDSIGLNGFEYAYSNVGVNKVMQAVGRLIRTPQDKGVALLLDYRYSYKNFKELFANSWSNNEIVKNCLDNFYNN
jgi:DNA excision repair protein ERCC-2